MWGGTEQSKQSSNKSIILENKVTKFISGISMEIYLSHMVIFRAVEKLGLNKMIGNGWLQYAATVVMVLMGAILFAVVMQKIIGIAVKKCDMFLLRFSKDHFI